MMNTSRLLAKVSIDLTLMRAGKAMPLPKIESEARRLHPDDVVKLAKIERENELAGTASLVRSIMQGVENLKSKPIKKHWIV